MEIRTKDLILRTVTENDIEEIARMWEYPRQRQIFQTPVLKGVDVSFVGKWIKGADKDDVRFLQPCASFSGEDYVTVYIEFVAVRKKYRKQGVAATMLQESMLLTNYQDFALDVTDINNNAIKCYTKMG